MNKPTMSLNLSDASKELSEAITALAVLENKHQEARKIAQQRVTMANGKLSALISIASTP